MGVKIGHASISETGGVNGAKGDSTGREVCVRSWYDGSWRYMAFHPDAAVREKHAAAIEAACANDNIGYGQGDRNTLNALARELGYDLSRVGPCNCDCSSLQNVAAVASGASGVSYGSNGWTTPDTSMLAALRAAGYRIVTDRARLKSEAYAVRGAIYVSAGHTVCALTNGARAGETLGAAESAQPSGEIPVADEGEETRYHAKTYQTEMHLLAFGDKGAQVESMQLLLNGKGFDCGKADGDFGELTEGALKRFQRAAGLEDDGEYGGLSQAALLNWRKKT